MKDPPPSLLCFEPSIVALTLKSKLYKGPRAWAVWPNPYRASAPAHPLPTHPRPPPCRPECSLLHLYACCPLGRKCSPLPLSPALLQLILGDLCTSSSRKPSLTAPQAEGAAPSLCSHITHAFPVSFLTSL
ncbi:hypothetical protein HJG60_009201 [Phyllostomus discolor]|uniref:Uncharacterized protein n=1 Tax=Phyllostomus discolor TaxID=89673 RepID=A0A833YK08_9CHIR|nr:hypothetical protein HJG60_009201 [Phyllostomus discolor]